MMKKKSEQLNWLQSEINKDKIELDKDKLKFISEIKKIKKDEIFSKENEKPNLWKRIIKVLMG